MKKLVFISILFISIIHTTKGQDKDVFDLITSGKWHLEYMEMKGQKMVLPSEMQHNNWVIFYKDGKQEGMEQGIKYVGKWEYDFTDNILITNDVDGIVEQKVISISENKFVISVIEHGELMTIGMIKIEKASNL